MEVLGRVHSDRVMMRWRRQSCAAGGFYEDSSSRSQALVSERNGTWGNAVEVPGLGALNKGGHAAVSSVSCPSAGHCVAGGYYTDRSRHQQAFVVSEA